MAIRNRFIVKIEHRNKHGVMIDYTSYAVFPLKFANLLDERLDECYLSLRYMQRKEFKPLARVKIILQNEEYYGFKPNEKVVRHQERTLNFFVANDKAERKPVGGKVWCHDLYLIEPTKLLEMYIVESLTWRNNLGKDYTKNAPNITPVFQDPEDIGLIPFRVEYKTDSINKPYVSPLSPQTSIELTTIRNIDRDLKSGSTTILDNRSNIKIYRNGILIKTITGLDTVDTVTVQSGSYEIIYNLYWQQKNDIGWWGEGVRYNITVVANQYPLKRFTITDIINRLLDLAEPLRLGETPRFKLNAEQATQFEQIYAPEFSMTRNTLRECLQEIGAFIHGEPRLAILDDGTYEIRYDMYGGMKKSVVSRNANVYTDCQAKIEDYCTSLDSSASNLVCQTDWAAGVIFEPNKADYRTVRTETQYTRISDTNMLISTDRPIYQVDKLEVLVPYGRYVAAVDITPYVVESTIYSSQLSSYSEQYPYSKAYGIYYTKGEKDIKGLSFKVENAISSVFEQYAIVNIIQRTCENAGISWTPPSGTNDYPKLAFRVTYLPIFDVRVAQSKSYYREHDKHVALIYNQSANMIESKYYGENLKGMVERLGNPEMGVTYVLGRLTQLPKAGELYDEDHYISAVSVEFLPTHIKCTIGLSKDFNRLSEYIGVDSSKRQWEVSEEQTYDRATLYHEYIVVGDDRQSDDSTLIGSSFMDVVADTFEQKGNKGPYVPLTAVRAWGGTYANPVSVTENGETVSPLPCVELPVLSTALGNSMVFIWNYKDNYSAGSVSTYQTVGQVSGYWQGDYQYTDYYGKMWYYNFDLYAPKPSVNDDYEGLIYKGMSLPGAVMPTERSSYISTGTKPYVYRKDSAEVPQFNMQVEFVTNNKSLIIGSGLASTCALIRGTAPQIDDKPARALLYALPFNVNKFVRSIADIPEMTAGDKALDNPIPFEVNKDATSDRFYLDSSNFTQDNLSYNEITPDGVIPRTYDTAKSWILVTPATSVTETVEDEQGNVIEQTYTTGGEILLASNGEFKVGDNIGQIWFTPVHDLYERGQTDLTNKNKEEV